MAIKFQNIKRKWQLIGQLDKRDFQKLVVEGIITVTAMGLIYFGCLFIFQKIIYQNTDHIAFAWRLVGINEKAIWIIRQFFTLFMLLFTMWLTNWRLSRRYRQVELKHVLSELDYIANGHYDHRISQKLAGRMGNVVESINQLVDSTVNAMAEERRVEQTKQELITNVSHDIRTPLTSIIGYLALIQDKQYETMEELERYVAIAYQKAKQMKELTDSLFEYSKMQHDEAVQKQSVPFLNFLTQIAAEYDNEAQKHNMSIKVMCDDAIVGYIDPNKMVRVYENVLSNAFKYSKATNVVLSAMIKNNALECCIANNGIMIDEEAINQLFVRFYREDNSRNTQIQGSGLGLAIVESIIHAHGGRVWVTSTTQKTAFYFTVPIDTSWKMENESYYYKKSDS